MNELKEVTITATEEMLVLLSTYCQKMCGKNLDRADDYRLKGATHYAEDYVQRAERWQDVSNVINEAVE